MEEKKKRKIRILQFAVAAELVLCLIALAGIWTSRENTGQQNRKAEAVSDGCIKWVDFDVSYTALCEAYRTDVESYGQDVHFDWVELLAYLGTGYGGEFDSHEKNIKKDIAKVTEKLTAEKGLTMKELMKDNKYYSYYEEAYRTVLGGMVGEFEREVRAEDGSSTWEKVYGLKAYSPIAKGFEYSHYDDFGAGRSYGYKRQHLGHDMMGQVGTPIIAVESGYVEAIGWNRYGGWRIGIRSFDKKRYYYYAHLRKNYPYHKSLKAGSIVQAGDVIGYLGRTGYSRTENTNNIEEPHLHFGMQLIFDESQKDGNHEIWINCYEIVKFLQLNRSETVKNPETREYSRVLDMKDPAVSGGV